MEALTRLVTESLARHGFDRPLDYRRLQWSRWFRCESPHSLLLVPSKPGVFAVAEEIVDFSTHVGTDAFVRPLSVTTAHLATGASPVPRSEASGPVPNLISNHSFRTPDAERPTPDALSRRMLAVTQFFEDDDMAFVLDRMLSRENPMRSRLISGRYFVRFVVIEDQSQRRSICNALNQWMANTAEKATGIGPHFATSLELTPATEYVPEANAAQQSLFDDADKNDQADVARAPSPASAGPDDARVGRTLPSASSEPALSLPKGQALSATADATNAQVETAASAVSRSEASGSATELGLSARVCSPTAPHLDSGAATNIHCPSPLPSGF